MFHPYACTECKATMPGVFYHYSVLRDYKELPENGQPCLGCMLTSYLNAEADHYKRQKMEIINQWINGGTNADGILITNTDDLGKLLSDFDDKGILSKATKLDQRRASFIERRGYDKETQEVQKPVTAQVNRSRRGDFLSAPMIGEWQQEKWRRHSSASNSMMAAYNSGRATNWMVHHRHYG